MIDFRNSVVKKPFQFMDNQCLNLSSLSNLTVLYHRETISQNCSCNFRVSFLHYLKLFRLLRLQDTKIWQLTVTQKCLFIPYPFKVWSFRIGCVCGGGWFLKQRKINIDSRQDFLGIQRSKTLWWPNHARPRYTANR